jgi:hypothetical protein
MAPRKPGLVTLERKGDPLLETHVVSDGQVVFLAREQAHLIVSSPIAA